MSHTFKLIALLLFLSPSLAQAQTPKIKFTYDASGNRIKREVTTMFSGGGDDRNMSPENLSIRQENIRVWPNPGTDVVNIEVAATEEESAVVPTWNLELYDVSGRLLLQDRLQGNSGNLNIEPYVPGTYFLILRKGKQFLKWNLQKI